jgi:hypothetical protein
VCQELAQIPNDNGASGELHAEALATFESEWQSCHVNDKELTFKQWAARWNEQYKKPKKERGGAVVAP